MPRFTLTTLLFFLVLVCASPVAARAAHYTVGSDTLSVPIDRPVSHGPRYKNRRPSTTALHAPIPVSLLRVGRTGPRYKNRTAKTRRSRIRRIH